MEKLKIVDGGVTKKIEFTDKYANGIFRVMDTKKTKKNCEILNINISGSGHPNELIQKVTKFGNVGILTIGIDNVFLQFILKSYAEKSDVEDLKRELPLESMEALLQTYNLTKMDTLDQFGFLGDLLQRKN